jgi:hypothetical protein
MVVADIKANPGRELQSVVISSRSIGNEISYSTVQNFPLGHKQLYVDPIEQLFDLGVPLVCAAGNEALAAKFIDELPMVVKDEKHPIINVGAVTWHGVRAPFSQYGDQLDLYAVGHDMIGQRKTDGTEATKLEGTSYGKSPSQLSDWHLHLESFSNVSNSCASGGWSYRKLPFLYANKQPVEEPPRLQTG